MASTLSQYDIEKGKKDALESIAEQLRIANLLALAGGPIDDPAAIRVGLRGLYATNGPNATLRPEIAQALGVD